MLRYECDNCRRLKQKEEGWILGFAAENIGVRAARREITFLAEWDEGRAADWLAVHFCSKSCKQDYMQRLFGLTPTPDVITEVEVLPITKRYIRREPAAVATHQKSRKRKNA